MSAKIRAKGTCDNCGRSSSSNAPRKYTPFVIEYETPSAAEWLCVVCLPRYIRTWERAARLLKEWKR